MDNRIIKILAIDDNLDNLISIKALIKESFEDYAVFTAIGGLEGLKLAASENPDVILLDIVMPDMDGFEVCTKLKENPELKDIPVVFVTALKGDKENRIKGLDVGAEAFLAKPIDESELTAQIRAMIKINLANAKKRDENARLSAIVAERTQELKSTHVATLNLLEDLRSEIDARKKSEAALRESEQKFRDMANLLPQVIFEMNLTGEITYVNHQAETLFGYSIDELLGMNALKVHVPEEHERVKKSMAQKLSGIQVDNKEFRMVRKDGSEFPVLVYINSIVKDYQTIGIRGVVIDITEQKKAEQGIRESEAKYREFVDNSPDAIAIYSDGVVSYVNKECLRLMRATSKDQLLGMPVIEFIHPDNREIVLQRMQAQSEIDVSLALIEEKYIRLDGTPIFVEVKVMPMLLDNKPAFQLTARDITARKIVEDAFEASRIELKTIYDFAPVMMCVVDNSKQIQFANKAFVKLTGISEKKMVGAQVGGVVGCIKSLDDVRGCGFGPNCINCSLRKTLDNTLLTGKGHNNIEFQTTFIKEGIGRDVFLLASTSMIQNTKERKLLLCLVDITERKNAERALKESEEKFRLIAENISDGIITRNANHEITYVSPSYLKQIGVKESDIVGNTTENTYAKLHPDDRDATFSKIFEAISAKKTELTYVFRVKHASGNYIWREDRAKFNYDKELNYLGTYLICRDITERKNAEELVSQNNARLELAMKTANMAWWEMDLIDGSVKFEKQKAIMLGYSPEKFNHYKNFMNFVHPDDQEKVMNAMQEHLNGTTEKYEIEYRILSSTGVYKSFYDVGSVSKRDNEGKPLIVSGLILDNTQRKQAEEALQKSEMFLRSFIDNVPFEIWARDIDGIGILENKKLIEHFNSILGHGPKQFYNTDLEISNLWESNNKRVLDGQIIDEEVIYVIEGQSHIFQQILFPIHNNAEIIGIAGFNIDITPRKNAEIALNESQEQLKMFAAHLQSVREEERTLLAREIHDDLGQILVAMKIDMGIMKFAITKANKDHELNELMIKFDELLILVDNTIKTTRRIMTDLRPEVLDMLGFTEAVRQHLKGFQDRYKIESQLIKNTPKLNLKPQQSVALFRIIQEALNNIAKHAKATTVKIIIDEQPNKLKLEIIDDGIGFDEKINLRIDSYGLIGMKERVFLLDGELTIKGEIGKGTSIKVEMPI